MINVDLIIERLREFEKENQHLNRWEDEDIIEDTEYAHEMMWAVYYDGYEAAELSKPCEPPKYYSGNWSRRLWEFGWNDAKRDAAIDADLDLNGLCQNTST